MDKKQPRQNVKILAYNIIKLFGQTDPWEVVAFSNRLSEEAALLGGEYADAVENFSTAIGMIAVHKANRQAQIRTMAMANEVD